MSTDCMFCNTRPAIKNSHILPRWTVRRALGTSETGKIRASDQMNKALQDIETYELLCSTCETLFSSLETSAARLYDSNAVQYGGSYDAEFVRFLVSIIWREGIFRQTSFDQEHPSFSAPLARALSGWRDFLLGSTAHLGAHP